MTDRRPRYRIGQGFDTHRLALQAVVADGLTGNQAVQGKPFVLGGVQNPHDRGPIAHSDGDVLLHALIDALVGAVGGGDIGERFPDHDPQHLDADSRRLLLQVYAEVQSRGWQIVNLDATVFAQRPKLSPYKAEIAAQIASDLNLPLAAVNIKAKTGERVGPVGREEAVEAAVVVLLEENLETTAGSRFE